MPEEREIVVYNTNPVLKIFSEMVEGGILCFVPAVLMIFVWLVIFPIFSDRPFFIEHTTITKLLGIFTMTATIVFGFKFRRLIVTLVCAVIGLISACIGIYYFFKWLLA